MNEGAISGRAVTGRLGDPNKAEKPVSELESISRILDDRIDVLFNKVNTLKGLANRLLGPVPEDPKSPSVEAVANSHIDALRHQINRTEALQVQLTQVIERFEQAI